MTGLKLEQLEKSYTAQQKKTRPAVNGVSLDIQEGELFTLLGPSGCGKTTTLRCIAGLERPDAGRITLGDKVVFDSTGNIFVPPHRRHLGMVFQSYAIWPHMTVFDNVAFPLRVSGAKRAAVGGKSVAERVDEVLEIMEMSEYRQRRATDLSGGQQQRLALARAVVARPALLLLDEPLSNLDARLREKMKFEVKRLQKELNITTIYVTHDQSEALALSDKIAVMSEGVVAQLGTPAEVYFQPRTAFVAEFLGGTNVLNGTIREGGGEGDIVHIDIDGVEPKLSLRGRLGEKLGAGSPAAACIRAENFELRSPTETEGGPEENLLRGAIRSLAFAGEVVDVIVDLGGLDFRARFPFRVAGSPQIGENLAAAVAVTDCRIVGR